jgi:hypothetical protein
MFMSLVDGRRHRNGGRPLPFRRLLSTYDIAFTRNVEMILVSHSENS